MPTYRVVSYLVLVTVLTAPFWLLGALIDFDLLPGLPIAALAVVCPTLAAALLSMRERGRKQFVDFLRNALDTRRAQRWFIVAALINPILFAAAFAAARLFGASIPDPSISAGSAALLFALFLPTALLEEIGWSGYALAGLQQRMRPLVAAILLGLFWALWHLPALLQVDRSAEWIAYWCLWTVSARVIMVWLYNWSGASVLAVALYHAISNVCWQLYPVSGSYFDPRLSGFITLGLALALTVTQRAMLAAPRPEAQ